MRTRAVLLLGEVILRCYNGFDFRASLGASVTGMQRRAGLLLWEVLQWLRLPGKPEGQCEWLTSTNMYHDLCNIAANIGDLAMLQWMRRPKPEGQCDWDAPTCCAAARRGDLEMLQWLRLPGKPGGQCDWDAETCRLAALGGHLEVLQWLRSVEDPCPWSASRCKAVLDGCLDFDTNTNAADTVTWIDSQVEAGVESDDGESDDD